jgi:hypothetical protein
LGTLLDWLNSGLSGVTPSGTPGSPRKSQPYPPSEDDPQLQKEFEDHRYYTTTTKYAQEQVVRGKDDYYRDVDPADGHVRLRQPTRSFETEEIEAVIQKRKAGYHVLSEKGKNLGGPYKSREQAAKRLQQVEYFKHKGA